MATLILLNSQVYQAPENVMMNQRVHYFLDLGLSYFYLIKLPSLSSTRECDDEPEGTLFS